MVVKPASALASAEVVMKLGGTQHGASGRGLLLDDDGGGVAHEQGDGEHLDDGGERHLDRLMVGGERRGGVSGALIQR